MYTKHPEEEDDLADGSQEAEAGAPAPERVAQQVAMANLVAAAQARRASASEQGASERLP